MHGVVWISTAGRISRNLGASVSDILKLLTADFVKLVAIAFIIAVPIGWIVMDNWLNNFAYQTHLGMSVFVIAGVLALLLSVTTISWQAIRAALTNPVDSLRNE